MPISKRKLEANRANAKKSTGPKTAAGKEAVSQNRTSHGLCGKHGFSGHFRVHASENQALFDDLLARFIEAEQPADAVERELVAKMARHTWLSERAIRLQEACFIFQPPTPEQEKNNRETIVILKDLPLYERYQTHHDRCYQRASNELAKRRKDRVLAERGFESQRRAEAEAKRREQQQKQRDELHFYKVATAQFRLERELDRSSDPNSALRAIASHLSEPAKEKKTAA